MAAFLALIAALEFAAAVLSIRFVRRGRLGRPWLLVSAAVGIMGTIELYKIGALGAGEGRAAPTGFESVEFSVALLLASGFALTERWFALKEKVEGRFRLIADVDRALVGVLDEDRILSAVCEGLAHGRGYPLAWIGVALPDGAVSVARSAGTAREFLERVRIRWDETPEGAGPTGTALRRGGTAVIDLFAEKLPVEQWREAASFGLRSGASVSIEAPGAPPMALTIYSASPGAFDRGEIDAIEALAHRIGAALLSARRHALFVSAKTGYDDLLRNQRDGIVCIRGGRIVRANPAAAALLGYGDPGQLIGLSPDLLLHDPEDQPSVRDVLGPPEGREARREGEAVFQRRDGSLFTGAFTVAWVPRPVNLEVERPGRWVPVLSGPLGMIIFRDVTARKEALEALRRERDFTEKVLETAGALVMEINTAGQILLFNRQCEEVTGYRASEVTGKRLTDLLLPDRSRRRFQEAVESLCAGRSPGDLEYPLLTKAGEERSVLWRHAALRDGEGSVRSFIVTGADMTDRRLLEAQIVGMQRMEAVGTLAGGIAHDFNNILTGILGNLDLSRRELPTGSPAATPIDESIRASERAAVLVRQLLEFSRRSPIDRRAVDLRSLAEEAVRLLSKTIDRRIEVEVVPEPDLWPASADATQLHQVLMNLCVNARDAIQECLERRESAPDGGYAIRVALTNATVGADYCRRYPYARPGDYVLLTVSDNGAGMDEGTRRRVFEPFFTTKKLGRGTGLGLSTVYGIVKQHEGWINLDSALGAGTVFRVYIPRAPGSWEAEGPRNPGVEGRTGRETVLLADDEPMIRELAGRILREAGYAVLTASDGGEAVETFLREREIVDLVILDVTMPRLSGIEALEKIRAADPGARVILSSGYPAGTRYNAEVAAQASAFLQKPYRAADLARTVREVLDAS